MEYLKKNPELLDKLLAKAMTPDSFVNQNNTQVSVEWPPWITAQRLSYRMEGRISQDILDKPVDVEPRQYPGEKPRGSS